MADMLTDPVGGIGRAGKGTWPAAVVQSEGRLDNPMAASVAVTVVGEFHQDCDELPAVEQQECIAVGAFGPDLYFVG